VHYAVQMEGVHSVMDTPPASTLNSHPVWHTEPAIAAERQQVLRERLTIQPDFKQGIYPFKGMKLTRADIEWLLITHEEEHGTLDWCDEEQQGRQGLDLRGADLRHVNLNGLPLACMEGGLKRDEWRSATLEQRDMAGVHLEGADLSETHLEGAILRGAHLDGATLRGTLLQKAVLYRAHLKSTYLREAHLEGANLYGAHLEGAYLRNAYLMGADLRFAFFDSVTHLESVELGEKEAGLVWLADVQWGGVNLSVVDWTRVKMLCDEYMAVTGAGEIKEISVTSFHGRGFLPGPFALSSPVTALAALEAVIGLFIEISFIATFTQRFFGR
jgi:uncharacterized protein YjbI with pentapeptide repeats